MVMDKINTDKKIQASQISYFKLMDKFPTDETFIEYFIKLRYPNGITCNKCGSDKVYDKKNERKMFACNSCHWFNPLKLDTLLC